jgi:hypothetical protein
LTYFASLRLINPNLRATNLENPKRYKKERVGGNHYLKITTTQ